MFLGNKSLIKNIGLSLTPLEKKIEEFEDEGKTVVILSSNKEVMGIIAVSDTLKESAPGAIKKLLGKGIDVWMISGDNKRTAKAIAGKAGIKNVLAEILPEGKALEVNKLKEKIENIKGMVAFVGDGINDAPALASADIGIAMGTGTDVAIETSGITLLNKDLNSVNIAIELSASTISIIKQNLIWAFGYNVILIPVAAGVLIPIFGISLSPMLAAAAMAASSISVVTNSLRLRNFKSK